MRLSIAGEPENLFESKRRYVSWVSSISDVGTSVNGTNKESMLFVQYHSIKKYRANHCPEAKVLGAISIVRSIQADLMITTHLQRLTAYCAGVLTLHLLLNRFSCKYKIWSFSKFPIDSGTPPTARKIECSRSSEERMEYYCTFNAISTQRQLHERCQTSERIRQRI